MISKISQKLRSYMSTTFIFFGLFVVILGGCVVRAGAWLGGQTIVDVMNTRPQDISDDQLAQVIREAREARSDEDKL